MLTETQMKNKMIELHNDQVKIKAAIKEAEEHNEECDSLYLVNAEMTGRIGAYEDILMEHE